MKKKILLLVGKPIGIDVLKFLKNKNNLDIETWSNNKGFIKNNKIKLLKTKKGFIEYFKRRKKNYDFLIIVYWPWLVPTELFKKFNNSVNFHPAFLPIGRGWYPHVHAIIKNFKWGVTLHKISPGIDNGGIWCQKKIKFSELSSATDLYNKSINEILGLFKNNIYKILSGKIYAKKQRGKFLVFSKRNLLKYDKLKANKKYKLIDLIKINNARSFSNKTYNYFYYNDQKYSFNIDIKKIK